MTDLITFVKSPEEEGGVFKVTDIDKPLEIVETKTEYTCEGKIGHGDNTTIFRATNFLDDRTYAIKKMDVTSQSRLKSYFNEIRAMLGLNHSNIIKLIDFWAESSETNAKQWNLPDEDPPSTRVSSAEEARASLVEEDTDESSMSSESETVSDDGADNLDKTLTSDNVENSNSSDDSVIFDLKPTTEAKICLLLPLCLHDLNAFLPTIKVKNQITQRFDWVYSKKTLIGMARQILGAVNYLHAKGMTHHDIATKNIFISRKQRNYIQVKLADFGLACEKSIEANKKTKTLHPLGYGSMYYASPEQWAGGTCDSKSDLFSTGVVLLQLLLPVCTLTELSKIHETFFKGKKSLSKKIMAELKKNYHPIVGCMVNSLLSINPKKRPFAEKCLRLIKDC